jgi:hypothetical protein
MTNAVRANAVMTGLVPVIHVVELSDNFKSSGRGAAWMAGTSPAMTERAAQDAHRNAAANRSGALDAARRAPPPAPPRKDWEGSAAPSVLAFPEIA